MATTAPSPGRGDPGLTATRDGKAVKSIKYEETMAGKEPTMGDKALSTPPRSRGEVRTLRTGSKMSPQSLREEPHAAAGAAAPATSIRNRSFFKDTIKRDSGVAPSTGSTARDSELDSQSAHTNAATERGSALPEIVVEEEAASDHTKARTITKSPPVTPTKQQKKPDTERPDTTPTRSSHKPMGSFHGIETFIPSGGFDDFSTNNMRFSNRGSMFLGDGTGSEPASNGSSAVTERPQMAGRRKPSKHRLEQIIQQGNEPNSRLLSADEAMWSQRLRSMYDYGNEQGQRLSPVASSVLPQVGALNGSPASGSTERAPRTPPTGSRHPANMLRPESALERQSGIIRSKHEAAGGVEDWEDVEGAEVDRYGFLIPMRSKNNSRGTSPDPPSLVRTSTTLQRLSEQPRGKRVSIHAGHSDTHLPRRQRSQRSTHTTSSLRSDSAVTPIGSRKRHSALRSATNRLPQNRGRRTVDEASDMLTLPPGLDDIAEEKMTNPGLVNERLRTREIEREEKWRKMARPRLSAATKGKSRGGGMLFDFDTKQPKIISRTWKGIPDKWRGTAWHAFLSASRRARGNLGDDDSVLVEKFHQMQDQDCADDVQIDVDVPRTINRHIMFRRRYRGGQRLLFRVLHALSLYFPDTGYVQGMAALAATLLCYYDEENTFIMLVRMWQLRGLEQLYRAGFGGLLAALEEFEKKWMGNSAVAKKLDEFNITSTAWGTRWYLTLFNMSVPFPAQLRIWDVFMLLGDEPSSTGKKNAGAFGGADLAPLHAASMALIDAVRDILIESDFETSMKVLTGFIPVRDEDVMMRVARAEYKSRRGG